MQTITDFFNWYFGLFTDADDKARIAAWAATLTTISFVITIILTPLIKNIKRRYAKIKVEAGMSHQIIASAFGTTTAAPLLTICVTNLTDNAIYIKNPAMTTSKKINGENAFIVPQSSGKFPRKIDVGEEFKQDYNTLSLNNQILSYLNDNDTVAFKVTTTNGKTYKSNHFTKRHIVGHMEAAHNLR